MTGLNLNLISCPKIGEYYKTPYSLKSLINDLRQKGILLETKRIQTGDRVGEINGYFFTDLKTNFKFTATELKLKSVKLTSKIIDDVFNLKNDKNDSFKPILKTTLKSDINKPLNFKTETLNHSVDFEQILDAFSLLFDTQFIHPEEEISLEQKRKKRKKRKRKK